MQNTEVKKSNPEPELVVNSTVEPDVTKKTDIEILQEFETALKKTNYIMPELISRVESLANSNNSRAKYLCGLYWYIFEDEYKEALKYLQEAEALAGPEDHAEVLASLGDLYYHEEAPKHWDLAYGCYTAAESKALTKPRRTAVKDILNHAKYNKRIMIMSFLFLALSILVIMASKVLPLYPMSSVLKIAFPVLEAVLIALGIRKLAVCRYSSIQWLLPTQFILWFVFLFFWLV